MILPQESHDITHRFFEALDALKELKHIRGLKTFSNRYGINTGNFWVVKRNNERIRPEWLAYLVRDYGVSATWLLLGEGKMFSKKLEQKTTYTYTKKQTISNDTDKA